MIDAGGPVALVRRGAASVRRREMIEVAYDKRTGDETRPLKGNYFCSTHNRSLFTFCFCVSTEANSNLQLLQSPESQLVFLISSF